MSIRLLYNFICLICLTYFQNYCVDFLNGKWKIVNVKLISSCTCWFWLGLFCQTRTLTCLPHQLSITAKHTKMMDRTDNFTILITHTHIYYMHIINPLIIDRKQKRWIRSTFKRLYIAAELLQVPSTRTKFNGFSKTSW